MRPPRDYDDIPGAYVQDSAHLRKGYHLNMFCLSLNEAGNRDAFRADEAACLDRYPMTPAQRRAVLDRDWLGLLCLGGNVCYTFKPAAFDGMTMQEIGAAMSGTGMSEAEFKRMLLDGGRPIEGNRRGLPLLPRAGLEHRLRPDGARRRREARFMNIRLSGKRRRVQADDGGGRNS